MKRIYLTIAFLFILLACKIPITIQSGFDQAVATQVSIAQTSTALAGISLTATITDISQSGSPAVPIASLTPTIQADDPKLFLGAPSLKDNLNNGKNFDLKAGIKKIDQDTTIKIESGSLIMTSNIIWGGKRWWLSYLKPKNFYLEGRFITQTCTGADQYGLVFRAVNYTDGFGYYFIATCDGQFNISKWDGNGARLLLNNEKSDALHAGSNQINDLGVWSQGNLIRLYANGKMLKEISSPDLPNAGYYGLFIDPRETPGMTIQLDEISYWDLQ